MKDPVDLRSILNTLELGFYRDEKGPSAWVESVAKDVEQVWKNAELFNPPGHVVCQSAQELRTYFDAQLEKQVKAELPVSATTSSGREKERPLQVVLTNWAFLNANGSILLNTWRA